MFKKKTTNKAEKEAVEEERKSSIKYNKPKILFIDLPGGCFGKARSEGYNVLRGTFGLPYKITAGEGYRPVVSSPVLPKYTEQEIIFIDLTPPLTQSSPRSEEKVIKGRYSFWANTNPGVVDPRPSIMVGVNDDFNRILIHGGLLVIFVQPRMEQNIFWAIPINNKIHIDEDFYIDNWSFLSIFSRNNFTIESDSGEEINIIDFNHPISRFFKKNIKDATFTATFKEDYRIKENWLPLLKNKYNGIVGGLFILEKSKGRILVLPQLSESKKINGVIDLLKEILPEISPHLFPHVEGIRWVEREEYELESVLIYESQKNDVKKRAEKELESLDEKIKEEKERLGFLHRILTQSGAELVNSVEECLKFIGFKDVVNVDKEIKEKETGAGLQEDLQIKDKHPILLIEVKGILGLPKEGDVIQVYKYVSRRMKEWQSTNVRGVSIINHQRKIPALERENMKIFTKQQEDDARNNDITILTTWDLFLLIRGMIKWNWNPEVVQELLYTSGRMPRVPRNYAFIGEVVHYWDKINVVGVKIIDNKLCKGDRIGYIVPDGYLEEEVSSLQVDNHGVEEAVVGQNATIKTKYSKELLRKGTFIYKII